MHGFAAILALASPAPEAPVEEEPVEIVVRAVRGKCRVQVAERTLTLRQLSARAAEWGQGRAVRVVSPRGHGYRCLARIAFRLSDHGVRLIHFVDEPDRP